MEHAKVKIAHLVCVFPPYRGGMGQSVYEMISSIHQENIDMTVITPQYGEEISADYVGFKLEGIKPCLKFGHGAFIPRVLFVLKKFDIVHLHFPFYGGAEIVWLAKKVLKFKFKLIVHYHMDTPQLSFIARFLSLPSFLLTGSLFKISDSIICSSNDYIAHSAVKRYYLKYRDKFVALSFGVDLKRFYPSSDKINNTVLFVGGLDHAHYFKGLDILFNSLRKLDYPDWKLRIVGDGDMRKYYVDLAEKFGIGRKVEFLGKVSDNDLPEIYRKSSFLVLPSVNAHEAFGIVLLEAMASGLPVIASRLPGVRSVFSDGEEGLLAEPGNDTDLREKILLLLNNQVLVETMGRKALDRARKDYDLVKISIKLQNIYQKIYL
jgi:glycosyltransferase involved in cell wall biosynthesis